MTNLPQGPKAKVELPPEERGLLIAQLKQVRTDFGLKGLLPSESGPFATNPFGRAIILAAAKEHQDRQGGDDIEPLNPKHVREAVTMAGFNFGKTPARTQDAIVGALLKHFLSKSSAAGDPLSAERILKDIAATIIADDPRAAAERLRHIATEFVQNPIVLAALRIKEGGRPLKRKKTVSKKPEREPISSEKISLPENGREALEKLVEILKESDFSRMERLCSNITTGGMTNTELFNDVQIKIPRHPRWIRDFFTAANCLNQGIRGIATYLFMHEDLVDVVKQIHENAAKKK